MKTVLVLMICMFSYLALAERSGENFEEAKSKMTSHLDERIANLQKVKSCVSSAKDRDALKACRKEMKDSRKEMRNDWKEKKEEWKKSKKSKKSE